MASDRDQYREAREKWEKLHRDKAYSRESGEGWVAIACSTFAIDPLQVKDAGPFRKEAFELRKILRGLGFKTKAFVDIQVRDLQHILTEPRISDVILIGHGSLSTFQVNGAHDYRYSWLDAIRDANHLKRGDFVQRHCGHINRDLPVPLGAFVVTSLEQVWATTNHYFRPVSLVDPENLLLQPVAQAQMLGYEAMKAAFKPAPAQEFAPAQQL